MVLELLGSPAKPAKVPDLIARRKYAEALALLREQLERSPGDASLRMQTADVLVLQGKIDEATRIFESVGNDFATQGFAAKAIAVLKKIQNLDPRRKDLDSRIVDLFKASAPPRTYAAAAMTPAASAQQPLEVPPEPAFGMLPPDEGESLDLALDIQPAAPPEMDVDFVDLP